MSNVENNTNIFVELDGRDRLELNRGANSQVHFVGCHNLMDLMQTMRRSFGVNVEKWPLPQGISHTELLLKEFILKLRGEWALPYQHEELCHCRAVRTHVVDQAIVAGAHTIEMVNRQTSAGTACGTCRPEIQKLIDYRLKK